MVEDRVELPRVYMAWLTAPIFAPGDAEADVAASVIGGGRSSRLFKKLVYEQQIAQDVSASQESLVLGSVFQIRATARPGHSMDELEKAIDEELGLFRETGPGADEIARAFNTVETRITQRLERLGGAANRLNTYNHYLGDPGFLDRDLTRYRDVSPASVKAFAQEQLAARRRVVVYGVPGQPDFGPEVKTPEQVRASSGEATESPNTDEPWWNERRDPGEAGALQLPLPDSFRLPNGLTVLVNERQGLPIVSMNLVVRTGSDANPPERPGLANFTAAMLDEGTATRSALQIADEVAQLGATLTTSSTVDASYVSAGSLRRNFPALLEIVADVVRRPRLPADEIERQRTSRLASLVQQRENSGAVANAAMLAALYGAAHPYGYAELGTEASNRLMTREEMQQFWAKNFVPNNTALIVSGQIGTTELRPLVEKAFGDWEPGSARQRDLGQPETTEARLVLVDKPNSPQTQIRIASIGVPRATPDYEALLVMNEVLGGLFSSRINLNLREEHGYTYGARSRFLFRRGAGPFVIASGVRTDVTAEAVSEVFKEIEAMRSNGLTVDELTLAKDALARSPPSEFETSGRVTGSTSNIYVYDLGPDYYRRFPQRLSEVTAEQAKAAAE